MASQSEEMPTDIRTGGDFWAEKRDGRWQLQMRHRGPGSSFCVAQINHWADNSEALTTRIVTACNAYEPMREALSKIANCGQSQEPDHWQFRVMARDTSNAALSTLPVNDRQTSDDAERLRKATAAIEDDDLRNDLADICTQALADAPEVLADPRGLDVLLDAIVCLFRDKAHAALKGVPQPATPKEAAMTEAQIKHMVDRFLMWKLPEHFNPDDGISFDPVASKGTPYEFRRSPSGTNLFSAEQATAMVRHMLEGLPQPASDIKPWTFQDHVKPWMQECFGPEIAADTVERNHRFLEEALELVQSLGCSKAEAVALVDYVYDRPVGEPKQEVGGVMVTLAALCLANGFDMHSLGDVELERVWGKIDAIRAKQASKPKNSPLPAQPASDDYQADAGAPALFENVNGAEGWQPEGSENLMALLDAIQRLEKELPGWWWSVGSCHVSADASIGPINRPWTHASIGPDSAGRDAHLLEDKLFDGGFHCDLRQPATCAESLNQAIDEALAARRDAELNFSNDAERDAVSLKPDTSSQPASDKSGEGK